MPLEFGRNAPFIVFDDADIEIAVKKLALRRQGDVIASRYQNTGQNLRLRQPHPGAGGVYEAFTKRLAEPDGPVKIADGSSWVR